MKYLSLFCVALALGALTASIFIRALDYWSRRISVATLYLQWANSGAPQPRGEPAYKNATQPAGSPNTLANTSGNQKSET